MGCPILQQRVLGPDKQKMQESQRPTAQPPQLGDRQLLAFWGNKA